MQVVALVGVGLALAASPALAAPPGNDELANATVITAFPFSDSVDTTEATVSYNEGGCAVSDHTVWYRFVPTHDTVLKLQVTATTFLPSLTLWSGGTPGNPACAGPGGDLISRVSAGQTYYIQLATRFFSDGGGPLQLEISELPAPANDAFSAATTIASLPFNDAGELTAATIEPGEPQGSPGYPLAASVWYRLTPTKTQSVVVNGTGIAVAAYNGSSLGSLVPIGSKELAYGIPLVLEVTAGTPVYLQVLTQFGGNGGVWPFTVSVMATPPPTVDFGFYPGDPSVFDAVSFLSGAYDSVGIGISSTEWRFGDGSTSTDANALHQYAKDGDYNVKLKVRTTDGRTDSITKLVQVRTHDVSILRFDTPRQRTRRQSQPDRGRNRERALRRDRAGRLLQEHRVRLAADRERDQDSAEDGPEEVHDVRGELHLHERRSRGRQGQLLRVRHDPGCARGIPARQLTERAAGACDEVERLWFRGGSRHGSHPSPTGPYDSHPRPSPSPSKRCGSGGRTGKSWNGTSAQSRSGGGGGMQTLG